MITETITWKDVEVEMPDAETTVLVCLAEGDEPVWLGYFDGEEWRDVDAMGFGHLRVTHWAEVPRGAQGCGAEHRTSNIEHPTSKAEGAAEGVPRSAIRDPKLPGPRAVEVPEMQK